MSQKKVNNVLEMGEIVVSAIHEEIGEFKAGRIELEDAKVLGKLRSNHVQAMNTLINDVKLSHRLELAEQVSPGAVERTLAISRKLRITRGLGVVRAA